ncbi:MAG: CHRD domain-containing protein [Gemmatimonadaceae bacterium]
MDSSVTSSRALIASAGLIAAIVVSATAIACGSDDPVVPKAPTYVATLNGANEVGPKAVPGTGNATVVKNGATYTYTITYTGMTGALTGAHIHGPAAAGVNASVIVPFDVTGAGTSGTLTGTFTGTNNPLITPDSLDKLLNTGNAYVNLHTATNGGGEIRGQLSWQP